MSGLKDWVLENKGKAFGILLLLFFGFGFIQSTFFVEEDVPIVWDEAANEQAAIGRCGEPPAGFIFNSLCTLLPAGNPDLTPEEVGFTFLRAVSNLDLETAARFSFNSDILRRLERFFDIDNDTTANQEFLRTLYLEVLLSLVTHSVTNIATFPDGRVAITYSIEILDLLERDFWRDDEEMIFGRLSQYVITERDTTRAHEFLHEYLLEYYQSPGAQTRRTTVTLTIARVEGHDHWVVADDSGLDALAQFVNRDSIVAHIMTQFDSQRW